jgi:hypothetical protein
MILDNYRSAFGDRVAQLIPQLRAAGATFHYTDDYYSNQPGFGIEGVVVELREAATKLVASVSPLAAASHG